MQRHLLRATSSALATRQTGASAWRYSSRVQWRGMPRGTSPKATVARAQTQQPALKTRVSFVALAIARFTRTERQKQSPEGPGRSHESDLWRASGEDFRRPGREPDLVEIELRERWRVGRQMARAGHS
jgi:hypothetical protein